MKIASRRLGGLAAASLLLASLTGAAPERPRFVLVSHAPDSDVWWNTVKNALKDASEDYAVEVDYRNPSSGDLGEMSRLLEQAAARRYDGVITTIADVDALKDAVGRVTRKQIPLFTINSGTEAQSAQLGAVMHVGQPDLEAGRAAGVRAHAAGVRSFVCVNHYATNPVSFERCRGFAEAIGADPGRSMLDVGSDPSMIEGKVAAYLRNNPGTDAVLALGPTSAHPTLRAIERLGRAKRIYFATFDLSPEIAKGIRSGEVRFAIDQQPYLQGYVPVALLALRQRTGKTRVEDLIPALQADPKFQARIGAYALTPSFSANAVHSGPGFVTVENLATVEKYAGQYR